MPLGDVIGGCLEVLFRAAEFFLGIGGFLWFCSQYVGSVIAYPFTLGKVWLADEHPVEAGFIGLPFFCGLIWLAVHLVKAC
jgi:hypothetical protein